MELRTELVIDAPAGRVWEILGDFAAYPQWNEFIRSIEGTLQVGARLVVVLQPPDSSPMTFRPTVVACEPGRHLSWLGRLFVPRLFDGEHAFDIEPLGEDRCRFVHRESFRGLLVPLLRKMLDTKTRAGFEAMNRGLKARAEASRG